MVSESLTALLGQLIRDDSQPVPLYRASSKRWPRRTLQFPKVPARLMAITASNGTEGDVWWGAVEP